jgi:hypothetical protein
MILQWLEIQDGRKRLTFWRDDIIEWICEEKWISMYGTATVANDQGPQGTTRLEFFDHCQFQRSHGKIFEWIVW